MGTPVVTVASGGIAVTEVENGLPIDESTTGGMAVTVVASGGLGVTYGTGGGSVPPGPATFDYYVDSVNGNDANPGTLASPFRTIAQASTALASAGTSLGLVKGSYWREQFTVPRTGFRIGVVGSGAIPVFDGADVIVGTWTQPDAVNQPNVWSIVVTKAPGTATEQLGYWENGARPARYATNATTDLQANGGWRASVLNGANPTIYIKAAADPNSDAIVREYSRRSHGIAAHTAVIGSSRTLEITGPIEGKRCVGHYNAFATSTGPDRQLLARDGNVHNMVSEADLTEDVICIEGATHVLAGAIPFTVYRANSAGFNPVIKRVFVEAVPATNIGLYSHDSSGGVPSVTFEQCSGNISSASLSQIIRGAYLKNNSAQILALSSETTRSLIYAGWLTDGGPVDPQVKARLIEHCAFFFPAGAAGGRSLDINTRNGSITIRNCIIYMPDITGPTSPFGLQGETGLDVLMEYCVIVRTPKTGGGFAPSMQVTGASSTLISRNNIYIGDSAADAGAQIDLQFKGTTYRTLANAQAAGFETNSVHLGTTMTSAQILSNFFQGDPATGDFRLKDLTSFGTFGDGAALNLAGPQSKWDWNLRATASGAPERWPVLPVGLTEQRAYISDPAAWDFYP